ncbi:hypothetical protein [Buttiauxella sp.]|uniref:hypothetical protein n=1 Tax=Buttiauxella sp. TaxID=1972222 RepID=UPI003C727A7C
MTNQFKKMMDEAFEATKKVLKQRKKDLSEEGWNTDKQKEFYTIFGMSGSAMITVDSKEEREKVKKARSEDKDSSEAPPMDPYIETRDNITAYIYMKESVDRLFDMCEKIYVKPPLDGAPLIHGNFVNQTDRTNSSANVRADQNLGLKPELYEKVLKINIHQNFVCKPLMGFDSQVSTLCHELSHFFRSQDTKHGGMGTDDMPMVGGFSATKEYIKYANDLKSVGDQDVFKNAYNIERYFELVINDND